MSEEKIYNPHVSTIVIDKPIQSIEIPYNEEDYISYPFVTCYSKDSLALYDMSYEFRIVKIQFAQDFIGTIHLGNALCGIGGVYKTHDLITKKEEPAYTASQVREMLQEVWSEGYDIEDYLKSKGI